MSILLKADLVLTVGRGTISNSILECQRARGEGKSVVVHVGGISRSGTPFEAGIIESLFTGTVERDFSSYLKPDSDTAYIFRNESITDCQRNTVSCKMRTYVGRRYGFVKIAAHALDYAIGGRYVFRRLCSLDNYPICSWVIGYSWETVKYRFLNLDPRVVQPDDMWDHVSKSKHWRLVCRVVGGVIQP